MSKKLVTIACDESGAEGENIMSSRDPFFVHGSTSLPLEEAEALINEFRIVTRTQAPEIKSRTALRPSNRTALLGMLDEIRARGNVYLLDKQFFMAAKLVNTLIAEPAMELGINAAGDGRGRMMATVLHYLGPSSIGRERWDQLLQSFNRLIRLPARAGTEAPNPKEFFSELRESRASCTDEYVQEVLEWMWQFRTHVENYGSLDSRTRFREFDPMFGTLVSVAMTWQIRLGSTPIEFVVDNYSTLDFETIDMIKEAASDPLKLVREALPRASLRAIRPVDSRDDSRVQIADILAGSGQAVAALAERGIFDDPLQDALREMLDCNGMWADGSALDIFWEKQIPAYYEDWLAARTNE